MCFEPAEVGSQSQGPLANCSLSLLHVGWFITTSHFFCGVRVPHQFWMKSAFLNNLRAQMIHACALNVRGSLAHHPLSYSTDAMCHVEFAVCWKNSCFTHVFWTSGSRISISGAPGQLQSLTLACRVIHHDQSFFLRGPCSPSILNEERVFKQSAGSNDSCLRFKCSRFFGPSPTILFNRCHVPCGICSVLEEQLFYSCVLNQRK